MHLHSLKLFQGRFVDLNQPHIPYSFAHFIDELEGKHHGVTKKYHFPSF